MLTKTEKFIFKTKPYGHQLDALNIGCDPFAWAYFCEMGTGKSKILLDNVHYLATNHKIQGALIVAPKGVYRNWVEQIATHYPDNMDHRTYVWSNKNTKKNEKEKAEIFKHDKSIFTFALINIDALNTTKGKKFVEQFLRNRNCLMAIDESTTIKNHKAKRTMSCINLGALAKYRRILTGQPIANSPLDVYGQAEFLATRATGSC